MGVSNTHPGMSAGLLRREAGSPNHFDGGVDLDQAVVNKEFSLPLSAGLPDQVSADLVTHISNVTIYSYIYIYIYIYICICIYIYLYIYICTCL